MHARHTKASERSSAQQEEFIRFSERLRFKEAAAKEERQEAYADLAAGVLGGRLKHALQARPEETHNALAQILKALKVPEEPLPPEIQDINEQIDFLLAPKGIMYRKVALTSSWYRNAVGCYLGAFKEDGRPVALVRKSGTYHYYDAEKNQYVRITKRNEGLFYEEALCFYPPLPLEGFSLKTLPSYMLYTVPFSGIVWAMLLALAATLLGMLQPVLTKVITGDALGTGRASLLIGAGIFLICVLIAISLLNAMQNLATERLTQEGEASVRASLMARILALPFSFFRNHNPGEITYLVGNIESMWRETLGVLVSSLLSAAFSFVYVFQLFLYAPSLVIPALGVLVLLLALAFAQVQQGRRFQLRVQELSAAQTGKDLETIAGTRKLKITGAGSSAYNRWLGSFARLLQLQSRMPFLLKYGVVLNAGVASVGWMVIYAVAGLTHVSTGDYFAFVATYGLVTGSFSVFPQIARSVASISSSLKLLRPFLQEAPEIHSERRPLLKAPKRISVSHLSFRYEDSPDYLFKDLSFSIKAGEYVAFVGPTGCGKTTLLRLLLGFERPESGAIYYDDHDLSLIDARSLRKNMGVVMQSDKLFPADIYSNIALTHPEASLEDVKEAARIACIDQDIERMPMGYYTLIDDNNSDISGGQIQRIAIARAVLKKPKILLMDEATSALDNETQQVINDNLAKLHATRIVIAHRVSTIKKCDRIIVLGEGAIQAEGTYEEVKKIL